MKINPYLYFSGNASEAAEFYEKVFKAKAVVAKYKDVGKFDKSVAVPEGLEEYVMHGNIDLGGAVIMLCDMPEKSTAGSLVQLMVSVESAEKVKEIFEVLKAGGVVIDEPQKAFWSDCFAAVKDKFGVSWLLMYESESQKKQTYGE